ncbi:MAG: LysM peptidoglycan-binding domain-containing protein [Bacteroidota bacterium]
MTQKLIFILIAICSIYRPLQASNENVKDSTAYSQLTISSPFPRVDPILVKLDSLTHFTFSKENQYFEGVTTNIPTYDPAYSDAIIKKKLEQIPAVFPMTYNSDVKTYINYFTQVKRGYTSRMLGLCEIYFPMFEEYLDKKQLPTELKYLPIIESAFNPVAQSRVGATGMWQIMYKTARMLGLNMNSYIDDRMDPRLSTEAGINYLEQLFNIYGDWQLALAAYNAGPGNVNKAIANAGGVKNFWAIKRFLPQETQNYVPSFIGVVYAMTYANEYKIPATRPIFNPTMMDTVIIYDKVSLQHITNTIGISKEELSFLNPSLKMGIIPPSENGFALRLPLGYISRFESNRSIILNDPSMISVDPIVVETTAPVWESVTKTITHVVRSGESLSSIAQKYAISLSDLKKWNHLKSSTISKGQKLSIRMTTREKVAVSPIVSSTTTTSTTTATKAAITNNPTPTTSNTKTIEVWETVPSTKYHYVKSGENLSQIADKYNVTVNQIKSWNKLSSTKIMKGQKLAIKTTTKRKVLKTVPVTTTETSTVPTTTTNVQTSETNLPQTGIKYALHTVLPGETITTIAKQYDGTSVEGIQKLNEINGLEVKVGTTLKIPLQ